MPKGIRCNVRRAVAVIVSINRSAVITVQPSATRPKRNEVSERTIGVVPHDEAENVRMVSVLGVLSIGRHNIEATRCYRVAVMTLSRYRSLLNAKLH